MRQSRINIFYNIKSYLFEQICKACESTRAHISTFVISHCDMISDLPITDGRATQITLGRLVIIIITTIIITTRQNFGFLGCQTSVCQYGILNKLNSNRNLEQTCQHYSVKLDALPLPVSVTRLSAQVRLHFVSLLHTSQVTAVILPSAFPRKPCSI